jgi:hypothetical protein
MNALQKLQKSHYKNDPFIKISLVNLESVWIFLDYFGPSGRNTGSDLSYTVC